MLLLLEVVLLEVVLLEVVVVLLLLQLSPDHRPCPRHQVRVLRCKLRSLRIRGYLFNLVLLRARRLAVNAPRAPRRPPSAVIIQPSPLLLLLPLLRYS